MAGPWEKYQTPAASAGPWDKYKTAAAKAAPKVSRTEASLSGFGRGLKTATENIQSVDPLSLLMDATGFGAEGRKALDARTAAIAQQAERSRPNYFAGGEIGGEFAPAVIAGGLGGAALRGLGGVLARVGPRAGGVVQRVGTAMQTGGIGAGRTAAQTAAMTRGARAGRLAERVAGGAAAGAAGAALTDQDVTTGAAFGGGLPVMASVLKRVGGAVPDLFKLPTLNAAKIIRETLGNNVEAAKAALRGLSPDDRRIAEQVMLEAGVENDAFYGLGKMAQERFKQGERPIRETLESQAAAREASLAGAAGGNTMEDIRAATRAGRAAVTEELAPIREEMYTRAGRASLEVPPALRTAQELEQQAAEQSGLARRMTFGAERAETRLGQADDLGDVFDPAAINRERGIAGAMTQRGEQAALGAIDLRGKADDLYQMVDDLAAQGMQPMRADNLISSLRSKIADPEILRGSLEERTIRNVIGQLEKATDQNGMLNPKALGKIRRSGINEIVNRLSTQMGGVPSRTGTPEAAQATVLELRKLIDNTLRRGGGGDLVDQFLQSSERGYAAVNRGELSGEALRLYKQDPTAATEFRALVGGDRPKTVGKFMGGGPENESFVGAFAGDPTRLNAMQQTAREVKQLNRMGELRSAGAGRAGDIMFNAQPNIVKRGLARAVLAPFPSVRIAAEGALGAERAAVSPFTQRNIAEAYASGPNMLALMNQYPTSARASEMISQLSPETRNALAQLLRSGTFKLNQPSE